MTFISVRSKKNMDDIGGFLDIINFLIGKAAPPQVLMTNYGFNEPGIRTAVGRLNLVRDRYFLQEVLTI